MPAPPADSVRVVARGPALRCAVCHAPAAASAVVCPACAALFHPECAGESGGGCPTLGCPRRSGRSPRISVRARLRAGRLRRLATFAGTRAGALTLGVALPLACLALDPILFRPGPFHGAALGKTTGLLGSFSDAAHALILTEWAALGLALTGAERRVPWLGPLLGGALVVGVVFASAVGVILFPFALFGLFALLLGALGFTPWLVALVYAQHARRLLREAPPRLARETAALALAGAAVALVPAFSADACVPRARIRAVDRALTTYGATEVDLDALTEWTLRLAGLDEASRALLGERLAALPPDQALVVARRIQGLLPVGQRRLLHWVEYDAERRVEERERSLHPRCSRPPSREPPPPATLTVATRSHRRPGCRPAEPCAGLDFGRSSPWR